MSVEASVDALRKCGYVRTTANLCNVALGSGILALPAALAAGGYAWSLAFTTLFLALAIFTLQALQRATVHHNPSALTYQALIRAAFGRHAETALAFLLLLKFYGTGIAYLIIIGDVLQPLVPSSTASDGGASSSSSSTSTSTSSGTPWFATRTALISAFTLVVVLPLCLFRTLRAISMASAIGVAAISYIAVFVAADAVGTLRSRPADEDARAMGGGWDLLKPIGVVVFAFGCHVQSPQVFAEVAGDRSLLMHEEPTAVEILVADTTGSNSSSSSSSSSREGSRQDNNSSLDGTQRTGTGGGSDGSSSGDDNAAAAAADDNAAAAADDDDEVEGPDADGCVYEEEHNAPQCFETERFEMASSLLRWEQEAAMSTGHSLSIATLGDGSTYAAQAKATFRNDAMGGGTHTTDTRAAAKILEGGFGMAIGSHGGDAYARQPRGDQHVPQQQQQQQEQQGRETGRQHPCQQGGQVTRQRPWEQQQQQQQQPLLLPSPQQSVGLDSGEDEPAWSGDATTTRRLYHASRLAVMSRAIVTTVLLSFVLQGTVAVLAYFKFGPAVPSNVLNVYGADYVPAAAARVSMALAVAFTYPLVHSTARYSLYSLLCTLVGAIADAAANRQGAGDTFERTSSAPCNNNSALYDGVGGNSSSDRSGGGGGSGVSEGEGTGSQGVVGSEGGGLKKPDGVEEEEKEEEEGAVLAPFSIRPGDPEARGGGSWVTHATFTTTTSFSTSATPSVPEAERRSESGRSMGSYRRSKSRVERLRIWLGRGDGQPPLVLHVVLTLLYVGITYGVAILIRDVGVVFSLLGSTAGVITNYLIPALLVLHPEGPWRRSLRRRSGVVAGSKSGGSACNSSSHSSFNTHSHQTHTQEDDERTRLLPSDSEMQQQQAMSSFSAWFRLWFWDGLWRDLCLRTTTTSNNDNRYGTRHKHAMDTDGRDDVGGVCGAGAGSGEGVYGFGGGDGGASVHGLSRLWGEQTAVIVAVAVLVLSFPLILLGCATPFL